MSAKVKRSMEHIDSEILKSTAKLVNKKRLVDKNDPHLLSNFIGQNRPILSSLGHSIKDFTCGAASYPETWWAANIQLASLAGMFGEKQYSFASIRQNILATLVWVALRDLWKTAQICKFLLEHHIKNSPARVVGRMTGGMLTNKVLFKGLPTKLKMASGMVNFVYVSFGAAIMAIAEGYTKLEPIVTSIMTGSYASNTFKEMSEIKYELRSEFSYNKHEYEGAIKLIQQVQELNDYHLGLFLVPVSDN